MMTEIFNQELVRPPIDVLDIEIFKSNETTVDLQKINSEAGLSIFKLKVSLNKPASPKPVVLRWKIPAHNVKGLWHSSSLYEKRLQADWELTPYESRVSVDSPVVSLFGHDDSNCLTFASSDAVHSLRLDAKLREEDSFIYCSVAYFEDQHSVISSYESELRFDTRSISFAQALKDTSRWWEGFNSLRPIAVPEAAKFPVYSTWYSYHQNLSVEKLLQECQLASDIGYKCIVIDDGWQTMDSNRGYDFTGDWKADRIPEMKQFVEQVHDLGMKVLVWYSVPFCGKKSAAYQRFKGKFLTENHRWAPVFDPRYPEVREYLVGIYAKALEEWDLDGFKLDFIDDFKDYPETELTETNGRDFASVNEATDQLMGDVIRALQSIKKDVLIEFRQKYIGPAMRKYGNMFRAFDCPNDSQTNRIRTTDVKLLAGNSAVHSDMFTWHYDEPVEVAALQFLNVLFAVPQVSVRLAEMHGDYTKMIRFYTKYWNENSDVLLDGEFYPVRPQANYPLLMAQNDSKCVVAVYEDYFITLKNREEIDIINAKLSSTLVLILEDEHTKYDAIIYNCIGEIIDRETLSLSSGAQRVNVPHSGMIQLKMINKI